MGWRWRRSINLGGGAKTTMTSRGMGMSWGLMGFRIGRTPTGSIWVSFTIPGTGISFLKYLSAQPRLKAGQKPSMPAPQQTTPASKLLQPIVTHSPSAPVTANQRILEEIRQMKP